LELSLEIKININGLIVSHGNQKAKKSFIFLLKTGKMITMEFNLMTSNIRFENPADEINNWPKRKHIWSKIVDKYDIDILCTQEGRKNQLLDAESITKLKIVDGHRDWIPERMYPSIFINLNKFSVLSSGDFWLSETPDIAGSKSFNSAFPRLCTWVEVKKDNNTFFVFNCHLDHVLDETRLSQSKVIAKQIPIINKCNVPYILAGDFNESPENTVRSLFNEDLALNDPFNDLNIPDEGTHHRFDGKNKTSSRIDWILITRKFNCKKYEIVKDHDSNSYPSDHFPVFANLTL